MSYLLKPKTNTNRNLYDALKGSKREWFLYTHTYGANFGFCYKTTPTSNYMGSIYNKDCEVKELNDVPIKDIFPAGIRLKCEGVLEYNSEVMGYRFSTGDMLFPYVDVDVETATLHNKEFPNTSIVAEAPKVNLLECSDGFTTKFEQERKLLRIIDLSDHIEFSKYLASCR